MLRLGVTQEWVDEGELPRERTKNRRWRRLYEVLAEATHGEVMVRENRIGASPATRWRRPCMRVAVYLSIDQGELLGGHNGVEAGGRKGRGSDDESSGAQLPKSKASVKKVDSEEHQSAAEADLPIAKEGMIVGLYAWQHHGMQRRDFRGVIDPLLSWRESIGRKRGQGGGKCKGKLQVPRQGGRERQGGRAEAKELHKAGVDGLLIKRAESEGLRLDARVLDQGTK
ncbi:hypothetical protein BHM03_00055391 [Ensete ventricosum]|nr:hypothetical protein BHM03_00055391 [Ensete ventricosum]